MHAKILMVFALVTLLGVTGFSKQSLAVFCTGCPPGDVESTALSVIDQHIAARPEIKNKLDEWITEHQEWLSDTLFKDKLKPHLQKMTEQFASVMMFQSFTIGTFFDAKHQLETQRVFQELQHQAHKDYQPSEDFCTFGTTVRSLAATEERANYTAAALNTRQMGRHLGNANLGGAESKWIDKAARWRQFLKAYCDPNDNMMGTKNPTGLGAVCASGAGDKARRNLDIDFTRLIDEKRTLDVVFHRDTDNGGHEGRTKHEEDVIALGNNLYGHEILSRRLKGDDLKKEEFQNLYMKLRAVAAKRNVAENSYNEIVALKGSGSSDFAQDSPRTREFLAAVIAELGVPVEDIPDMLGERPSYYAQLEVLAKKIYQSPDFFANLYDKPANISRKAVALKAIELMLDRAIYESQIRQEMLNSVLLSTQLQLGLTSTNMTGGQ